MLTKPRPKSANWASNISVVGIAPLGLHESYKKMVSLVSLPAAESDQEMQAEFGEAQRKLVAHFREWIRPDKKTVFWTEVRELIVRVVKGEWLELPLGDSRPAVIEGGSFRNVSELAALMLQGPAWRHQRVPALSEVPDAWWGVYAEWMFAGPQGFSRVGDAEHYARHQLGRLQDLASWLAKSPGSAAVQSAARAYLTTSNAIPLYFSEGSLRKHAELRGEILSRLITAQEIDPGFCPLPREGRRLRVGFVNRHFAPQTETYTTLPSFEQLDPERFEVMLFACHSGDSQLEAYARSKAESFQLLPTDLEGQLAALRTAGLDVVVFGTNLTAVVNEVTRIALHRVAPLQVVNNSSCITSGFPEVDMYVSGKLTETAEAPEHFTERLGLLPGPTHAFNYEADRQAPAQTWTKADLGIPDDAIVFVSAANYYKIIPEMREAWARLLAAVPGSYLLLHPFNPNWSSTYPIKRFCNELEAALDRHGVNHDRLVVSSMKLRSRSDVVALMSVGDVYLDTAPFSGVNSLIDPLEQGVPVVVWEGSTMRGRMGAALLRSLGLPELIAWDGESYQAIAARLATDVAWKNEISLKIRERMDRAPIFLDTLAASEAFGNLLESAYDEIEERGLRDFKANKRPLVARRAVLLELDQRWEEGNRLLSCGHTDRAVSYLLAALQHGGSDGHLWLDVAKALYANNQIGEAIQSLRAALRLDTGLVEGWRMLAELSDKVGITDMAEQARSVLAELTNSPMLGRSAAGTVKNASLAPFF